jgi:ferredoxin-NADP reductase/predicted pyridoxine 5'-phosphate oxidase superfamily flavin-nucleotide-binding protein
MDAPVDSPFHRGEQTIQSRVGVRDRVEEIGRRFIRDHMPEEHRAFYGQLPFIVLGSVDDGGRPWASVLTGDPGFIESHDEHHLRIGAIPLPDDPAAGNLAPGSHAGLLGIQFHDRRRNRMNGRVVERGRSGIVIEVDQSFGNCPMYIQARDTRPVAGAPRDEAGRSSRFGSLDEATQSLVRAADSFFIASQFAEGDGRATDGIDVSHRGGRPGFVRVEDPTTLVFPDFTGNTHFNTLGNILMNPQAGLLFLDYENGDLVYMTGAAEIVWEGEELDAFIGAERLVRFTLDEGRRIEGALPYRWRFRDYSPVLEQTGTWEEVDAILAERRAGNTLRDYTVTRIAKESETIRSYYLSPADGSPAPTHVPGQFLPIELRIPGLDRPVPRTYTISNAPDGQYLRLSIKREPAPSPDLPPGLSSHFFHDHVAEGAKLNALGPRGAFTLDSETPRPIVLLSAGVGMTPMIAMLEQLVREQASCGTRPPIWFVHGARDGREHAFRDHVRDLAAACPAVRIHVAYSQPDEGDRLGVDFHSQGHVDLALLKTLLPLDDYDFYLCGPTGFMEDMYEGLRELNIAEERIRYEFFGPSGKLGGSNTAASSLPDDAPSTPIAVRFEKSGVDAAWDREKGTLLDLAESSGLSPAYTCRSGVCQTCSTRKLAGKVGYTEAPMMEPPEGEVLICCAYPRAQNTDETLILDL